MVYANPIVLLIFGVEMGFVLPLKFQWIQAMKHCAIERQTPSLITNNLGGKAWLGTARYVTRYGVITLQIEEIQKEKNCFAFVLPHLSETFLTFNSTTEEDYVPVLADLLSFYLFNGTKCFFAEYNDRTIKQLPTPTECLINSGNTSKYVPCTNTYQDGCQYSNGTSTLMITLSFLDKCACYSMKDNKICKQISDQPVPHSTSPECNGRSTSGPKIETSSHDSKCSNEESVNCNCYCSLLSLVKQYEYHLIGMGCMMVILHILYICCCFRCQIRKQLSVKKEERGNEPIFRPRSETIECVYINRDLSSQNATYDVITDIDQSSNTTQQIVPNNMQDYDKGISRSAKSNSGDYDLAWAEGSWSAAVASPHVDYAQVEVVRKQKMDTVPEEEIYSKQKISWLDGNEVTKQSCSDIRKETKEPEMVDKKNTQFKTERKTRAQIRDDKTSFNTQYEEVNLIRDQKQRFQTIVNQTSCNNVYSKVKIAGVQHQNTQEEIQRKNEKHVKSINYIENGSCINKTTGVNVSKTEQEKLEKLTVKKSPNKVTSKNLPGIQRGSGITRSMIDKVKTLKERPMEELYNNLMKTDDTIKTLSPEKGEEIADEGTIVLRTNMNKVVMETKL